VKRGRDARRKENRDKKKAGLIQKGGERKGKESNF